MGVIAGGVIAGESVFVVVVWRFQDGGEVNSGPGVGR